MALIDSFTTRLDGVDVTVRCAEESEAQAILDFGRAVLDGPYLLFTPEELPETAEEEAAWIAQYRDNPSGLILVAEANGRIAGLLNFEAGRLRRTAHQGQFGIALRREFRGMGIGPLLIETLMRWAGAHPRIERVWMGVFAGNAHAIHVYRKLGFVEEGRLRRHVRLGDGQYEDEILMARFVKNASRAEGE